VASSNAGLGFRIEVNNLSLVGDEAMPMTRGARAYLSAVVEYMVAEYMELAGNVAKYRSQKCALFLAAP
jgi:hypothetical protein